MSLRSIRATNRTQTRNLNVPQNSRFVSLRGGRQHRARDGAEGFRDGRGPQRRRGDRHPARHRIHDHLSARADAGRVLQGGAEAQAGAAVQRRLRQCRPRGRAARQGAALEQWRRERDLGFRARADADAHRLPQGDLAARQRVGRTLARQRAGAAHVRALRQDARHHRLRHHRQEGRAARARLRHACAVFRHRAPVGGRGGPARRQVPPAARAAALVRHRVAARAAERLDPTHDRRGRARADEADTRSSSTPRADR